MMLNRPRLFHDGNSKAQLNESLVQTSLVV